MQSKDFMSRLDHARIVRAIAEAETKTSGEIRVFIERGAFDEDPLEHAKAKFLELGMTATAERNAVLILVAPRAQKFAVVGDEGVHQKCGPDFWNKVVAAMRTHFQHAEFTEALVEAIETSGQLLAEIFPRRPDDRDELPNIVLES